MWIQADTEQDLKNKICQSDEYLGEEIVVEWTGPGWYWGEIETKYHGCGCCQLDIFKVIDALSERLNLEKLRNYYKNAIDKIEYEIHEALNKERNNEF